ncbi:MAG: response regulator [Alphaproteobacteria bacterium]|jgi:CheY-like chemotaxis protein
MPEMDGLTFVGKLREDKTRPYAATPVVMLTGQSTAADVRTAVASGINGYIVKPCSPKSLIAQVEKILN